MKVVVFKGTLSEVRKQAAEWEAANPQYKIIERGVPSGGAHHASPGQNLFDLPNWSITLKYEGSNSN